MTPNLCMQRGDTHNAGDASSDLVNEAADCVQAICAWIEPGDSQLVALFNEAGVADANAIPR